jgi:hypothetical protein
MATDQLKREKKEVLVSLRARAAEAQRRKWRKNRRSVWKWMNGLVDKMGSRRRLLFVLANGFSWRRGCQDFRLQTIVFSLRLCLLLVAVVWPLEAMSAYAVVIYSAFLWCRMCVIGGRATRSYCCAWTSKWLIKKS